MSIIDRFSKPGEWTVGKDSNLQFSKFSMKKLKTTPRTTIEARRDGNKVTGPTFLAKILHEIKKDPELSNKLKKLKENESVKVYIANLGEYLLSKSSTVERTKSASSMIQGPPPPINRSTKPKQGVREITDPANKPPPLPPKPQATKPQAAKNERDIWNELDEKGEVTL